MKPEQFLIVVLLAMTAAFAPALGEAQSCGNQPGIGNTWSYGNAVLFQSKVLNIDADGAPNSYLLDGNGLSYTCDGVVALENGKRVTSQSNPSDWQKKCNAAWANAKATNDYRGVAIFGFQTDKNNNPLIQAEGDPFPGKGFISITSVIIPDAPDGTQRRYVDALKIPYVVLPPSFVSKYKIKPGTLAVIYRKKTNNYAFAVFADSGNLGEASIKLHQDLGGKPIVKIQGIDRAKSRIEDPVLIAVFPSQHAAPIADSEAWNSKIQSEGGAALNEFGGLAQLQECAK
jgi:hypothetical protein